MYSSPAGIWWGLKCYKNIPAFVAVVYFSAISLNDNLRKILEMSLPVCFFPRDRRLWHYFHDALSRFAQPTCFQVFFLKAVFEQMRMNRLHSWMASNIMQCIITRPSADVAIMSSVVCIIHKMLHKWGWISSRVQSPAAVLLVIFSLL